MGCGGGRLVEGEGGMLVDVDGVGGEVFVGVFGSGFWSAIVVSGGISSLAAGEEVVEDKEDEYSGVLVNSEVFSDMGGEYSKECSKYSGYVVEGRGILGVRDGLQGRSVVVEGIIEEESSRL